MSEKVDARTLANALWNGQVTSANVLLAVGALRQMSDELEAIGAGGVEPLRKVGLSPSHAAPYGEHRPNWLPFSVRMQIAGRHGTKVTAAFNKLVRDVIETYIATHAAQPSRECLQQALAALIHARTVLNHHNLPLQCGPVNDAIIALQAAPPAPAGVESSSAQEALMQQFNAGREFEADRRAALAAAPAQEHATQLAGQEDAEQSALEDWLARVRPSGDADSVKRQWEKSGDYADLHAAPVQAQEDALAEVIGCFEAAEVEGLTAVLAESADARLVDLVNRRLMHALYAARAAQGDAA